MSRPLFTNNAATSLAEPITPLSTVLQVTAGTGGYFPQPSIGDYFMLTLVQANNPAVSEIVECIGRSGDILTVVRGQEGTAPQTFNLSDNVELRITASSLNLFAIGGGSGGTASGTSVADFTATAGQTVFTLPWSYTQGIDNLAIFVNGSKQIVNVNYVETSSTSFTMASGLNVGDLVEAIYNLPLSGGIINASNVVYNKGGTGAVNQTVQDKLQEFVSVKDFGAVGDGVTDDTAAIVAAYASGAGAVYFPTGTYPLNAAIAVPTGVLTYGEGYSKSTIKCRNDLTDRVFFTLNGNTEIKDIAIGGTIPSVGTGVLFSGGTYTFSGHGKLNKAYIYYFAKGVDVNSWFDLVIDQTQISSCTIGLNATPPTNGGDNGYINCLYVTKSYFRANGTYDAYFKAGVRISNAAFTDTIFDPGASIASVYLHTVNPITFDNCYFETGATDAVNCSLVAASFNNCFFPQSDLITCTSADNQLDFNNCRNLVIYANSVQNNVQISNSSGVTVTSTTGTKLNYINSTVNGTYYPSKFTTLTLGTGDAVDNFVGYTKSITQTITANTSAAIITNQVLASDKRWGFGVVGTASFSDLYSPGLVLTVTCATTASNAYFSVIATNTTGSNIVITAKTLNVIIQRMASYTTL